MSETHNAIYLVNSDNSGTEYGNTGGSGGAKVEAEYEVTPAQNNHASGTIIYFNQKFYKVTTAITAGDTITIGTNITNANLGTGTQVFVKNMPDGLISANNVTYDNTTSGLTATDVQDAVDEISSDLSRLSAVVSGTTSYSDLKTAINALSNKEFALSAVRINDTFRCTPTNFSSSLRTYAMWSVNSNNDSVYDAVLVSTGDNAAYIFSKKVNGTSTSTVITLTSWELYYIKDI